MVLPFLALGAMALGGVVSAVGASKQAQATNEGIEKANKTPLKETLKETTTYGQKITTSYGQKVSNSGNINLADLVKDAEAAGFNPLTIVRSGGLSGYFNTTMKTSGKDVVQYTGTDTHSVSRTSTGHNAHLYANKQSPGGSFLSGLGNTISQVASAGLQNTQHLQSLASNERMAALAALPSQGFGRTGGAWGSTPAYGGAASSGLSPLVPMEIEGYEFTRAPGWSSADTISQEFGEPAEWLYSLPLMVRTLMFQHNEARDAAYGAGRDAGVTLKQRLTEQQPGAGGNYFDPFPGWNIENLGGGIMQPPPPPAFQTGGGF